jgi:hypothetical protein
VGYFSPMARPYFCWLLLACGCGGLGDATGSTCPPDSMLTYENFGRQLMAENCSCHVTGDESPSFDTLSKIQANAGDIDRAAAAGPNAVNDFMPDDKSMPEETRRQLGEWLACGAP